MKGRTSVFPDKFLKPTGSVVTKYISMSKVFLSKHFDYIFRRASITIPVGKKVLKHTVYVICTSHIQITLKAIKVMFVKKKK